MAICLLKCNHTVVYDPEPSPGDLVYCRKCWGYSQVTMSAQEWYWKCHACATSRRFGTDEGMAHRSALRHQRKYSHVVLVKHGYDTVTVVAAQGEQLSLGGERIEWVKQHQGALRAVVENYVHKGQSTVDRP